MRIIPLLLGLAFLLTHLSPAAPVLSEFLALGNESYRDEDRDTPDWLEIHNPGPDAIDLAGYALTDNPTDLTKWIFPATSLSAGDYLVVFASDKDRAVAGSTLHTNFKLSSSGEYLALVAPDGSTVISEFSPAYPPQALGYSYGIGTGGVRGYFKVPTPDRANGAPLAAPLLAPTVTPPGATFSSPIEVTLNTEVPGGIIRYTTNGSLPNANSTIYEGPLSFRMTTHLRARVFDSSTGASGATTGEHFLRLAGRSNTNLDAPLRFTSNLPIMVIENFGAGSIPGPGQTLQTARLSVHEVDPATGRSALANDPQASMRMGFRRRGQSSSGFSKPQYRVELRNELDEDLDVPLLGLPTDSDWVFNGPWTDKALIRNPLAFELGRTIGIEAPRTRHFELFLSTNGGNLDAIEYVGVYVLMEKIKISPDRVDIETLDPGARSEPTITGGYLMRFEPPGIVNEEPSESPTGWTSIEIIDPATAGLAQRNYLGSYLDDFVSTLGWSRGSGPNNSGRINNDPLTGYPAYIDVDSFVHLHLINELLRDQDAYVRSDYMFKDRNGKLHKGPMWDYNLIAGTGCCFDNRNTSGWQYQNSYNRGGRDHSYEPDWFVPLLRDPDFRQQYIDRWGELRRDGVLELNNLTAVIDGLADPLSEAAVRNFTKWNTLGNTNVGFPTPATATWEEQVEFMKTWLATRMEWIDGQFLRTPLLTPDGGEIAAGTRIAVEAHTSVYYTTDGSDPRLPGGAINPAAQAAPGSGIEITSTTLLTSRGRNRLGWSAPASAVYVVGTAADAGNLVITELNYHPQAPSPSEAAADPTYRDDDFEFIELKNIADSEIDLSGARFIDGIEFTFPVPTVVPPGEYILIVENAAAFGERYGTGLPVAGVYANKISNDGETLRLVDVAGNDILHFTFNDIWHPATDGAGRSLVAANEGSLPGDYGDSTSWRPSSADLGSPGRADALATYASWLATEFTAAELADPAITGPDIDLDANGYSTFMSYALGLDPRSAEPAKYPVAVLVTDGGDRFPALTFRRRQAAVDLVYRVMVSDDLVDWSETTTVFGPVSDNNDGTETVTIRDTAPLGASPRFLRLEVDQNTASITTYADWLATRFTPAELSDPDLAGPDVDLDANGYNTLMSYALGLDPRSPEPAKYPVAVLVSDGGDQFPALTFRRRKWAVDLTYRVMVSSNLNDWAEATALFGEVRDNRDGTESVTIRDTVAATTAKHRFMRLEVQRD